MVLKGLKKAMGDMRPEDLAARSGLSISTILKARRGANVTLGSATVIANHLKRKLHDLEEEPKEVSQ